MFAWGNKHFAPEGASVLLIHTKTGATADPVLVDRRSGRPLNERDYAFAPGPAAGERTRRRYALVNQKRAAAQQSSNSASGKRIARKRRAS